MPKLISGEHFSMETHKCTLEDYKDEFARLPKHASIWTKLKRCYKTSILMSYYQPQARLYYRTYTALRLARYQHANSASKYIVHPFSSFRQHWELMMTVVLGSLLVLTPLHIAFPSEWIRPLVFTLNLFGIADIVMRFCTGYTIDHLKTVDLNQHSISLHYLTSANFYLELISAIPFVPFGLMYCTVHKESHIFSYTMLLSLVKVFRIKSFLDYFGNALEYWNIIDRWYLMHLKFLAVFLMTTHWCGCIMLIIDVYQKVINQPNPNCYNWKPAIDKILNAVEYTNSELYYEAVFRASARLFCITWGDTHGQGMAFLDVVVAAIVNLIGYIFSCFALVLFIQMMFRLSSNDIRYECMMNQLSKYMRHKQLPMKMQERLINYYEFTLRKSYNRDTTIYTLLSSRIRQEVNMHVTAMMARTVTILKDQPDSVITRIISMMKPEVYLPNDVIVEYGAEGNCMYFIYTGTVAVYSATGKEICHLEDGAYFGEISLMKQDRKRIGSVVALENTELYRLDRKHFHQEIRVATPDLYKRMEAIAERRSENMVVMEEIHRKQMLEITMQAKQETISKQYF